MRMGKITAVVLVVLGWAFRADAQGGIESSTRDQTNVEVTVYNNNLGLIKDTRGVQVPVGAGELRFMDVASSIMPVTVHVKSLNAPDKFAVLEQNYEYDLIDYNKLLNKYVGRDIKLVSWNQYQDRKEVVEARLVSNNNGDPVYEIGNEIYLGYPGSQILPKLPENLIANPTLMWMYQNESKAAHQLEVSYLTGGIGWKADYVFVLNRDDTAGDLSGWVTVDNKSGATYKDAKLKLVAGEVQRAREQAGRAMDYLMEMAKAPAAPQFEEKGFFEYHIYDLQRRTTIKDRQTKQISLLEAGDVKTQKEFLVYGQSGYFTGYYRPQSPKQDVSVYIKFDNKEENRLGMPLPAGVIRFYKKDAQDSLQFVGEDRIEHTPKDEEVSVKVGEAFDVAAERRQTDYRRLTTQLHESEWEITLRNHKEEDVTVGIVEPLYGNWQVIASSHPYEKKDAFTIRFDVKVPKDEEVKVTYRLRVGL